MLKIKGTPVNTNLWVGVQCVLDSYGVLWLEYLTSDKSGAKQVKGVRVGGETRF